MQPMKLGTVWTARASIQYIDDQIGKWVTVSACIDTPNAIQKELAKAKKKHPGKTLWVKSDTSGRYIP